MGDLSNPNKEKPMKVYATLPNIMVTGKGFEKKKEIYVISLASDLHGESNHRPPALGATNETLLEMTPDINAAMKFFVVAVSNIFEGITPKQPPSLSGDGIVLYPPSDPQGMLALHFVIVESDKKTRNVGKVLQAIFGDNSVKNLLTEAKKLTASVGNIPASLLTSLFGVITTTLPNALMSNKDDILFSHSHSGVDFNSYGGSHEGAVYPVRNDRAGANLKIWVR